MDELTIDEKVYISSKRAAKITGYAKDYVGQLCREGRVDARLVGRNWYVLESSIMEHRFGTAPKDDVSAEKRDIEPALHISNPVEDAWEAPVYHPEVPAVLPVLEAKPVEPAADPKKVVSEMQEAWQEWFTAHKPVETALPDGSQEFDGHLVPAVLEEVSASPNDESAEESVHIQRLRQTEQAPKVEEESIVAREEVVQLHRVAEAYPRTSDVEDLREVNTAHSGRSNVTHTPGTNLVLKSLFAGIAIVAVCVALAGTGFVGDTLQAAGGRTSGMQPIIDALSGGFEYKSIK